MDLSTAASVRTGIQLYLYGSLKGILTLMCRIPTWGPTTGVSVPIGSISELHGSLQGACYICMVPDGDRATAVWILTGILPQLCGSLYGSNTAASGPVGMLPQL
eukprot:9417200-Pyramimonas_sp.AAC.1